MIFLINSRMAFILHGSCHGHHSHSQSHPHSHSSKPVKGHKYTSQCNDVYQPDDDEFIGNPNNNSAVASQNMNGGNILTSRSDSICSYRSPDHSRTNSFSKKITSNDGRKSSVPPAILHLKLTETANQRSNFEEMSDRSFNQNKYRNSQDTEKNECEVAGFVIDEHTSEFSKKNINIQAAVIHVLGDFIQSIGVFVAALVIKIYVSFLTLKLKLFDYRNIFSYYSPVRK